MDGLKEEYNSNTLPCIGCICLPICKNIRNKNKHLHFYVTIGLLKSKCSIFNSYLTYIPMPGYKRSYTNNKKLTEAFRFYE